MSYHIGQDPVPKKVRKFWFGYHLVNGYPFSMKWVEDDGHVVGGIPDYIEKYEIT